MTPSKGDIVQAQAGNWVCMLFSPDPEPKTEQLFELFFFWRLVLSTFSATNKYLAEG